MTDSENPTPGQPQQGSEWPTDQLRVPQGWSMPEEEGRPLNADRLKAPPQRRGCLIGCLSAIGIAVLLAITVGLVAKHTYDHWLHGDETTTTVQASGVKPTKVSATRYSQLLSAHGSLLSNKAQIVGEKCKNVTKNKAECREAVVSFRNELQATQTDLNSVLPPEALANADAKLRQSVADGLAGSDNVIEGLDGHPIAMVQGLAQVAKAATELKGAQDQLNKDLATTSTTRS